MTDFAALLKAQLIALSTAQAAKYRAMSKAEIDAMIKAEPPYPMCGTPAACAGKGYCTRDPACNE